MEPDRPRLDFFVPGRPKSTQTGSVVRAGGRLIPIRRGTAWSAVCGLVARQYAPPTPLAGPLAVAIRFQLPAPKKRRALPTTRPDIENLVKGLLDSWNGVLWADDSQIVDLWLTKGYGVPGVNVTVRELAP